MQDLLAMMLKTYAKPPDKGRKGVYVARKQAIWFALVITILTGFSCTLTIVEKRILHENAKFNFVIASDSSHFKDHIRDRIIAEYKKHGSIDVINIHTLPRIESENYDVILIMDTCLAGSNLNSSTRAFLDKTKNTQNVVLLMTARDPGWQFSYKSVDAITSASSVENEEVLYQKLIERIDKIIAEK